MKFTELPLRGAFVIELEPRVDERGLIARAFRANELGERGLKTDVVQANLPQNVKKGTHGYQALTDDSEVQYLVTQFYSPGHEAAVRWNDPRFAIAWPLSDVILSPKDAAHPDFTP